MMMLFSYPAVYEINPYIKLNEFANKCKTNK
jgi:hypothetical protein